MLDIHAIAVLAWQLVSEHATDRAPPIGPWPRAPGPESGGSGSGASASSGGGKAGSGDGSGGSGDGAGSGGGGGRAAGGALLRAFVEVAPIRPMNGSYAIHNLGGVGWGPVRVGRVLEVWQMGANCSS
jgi:hypothetical protein